jgi:hypothetical protein
MEQRVVKGGDVPVEFEMVRRMGLTVVEVPGLRSRVCYVEDQDVALVRAGMDQASREVCAEWLLTEIASPASATAS